MKKYPYKTGKIDVFGDEEWCFEPYDEFSEGGSIKNQYKGLSPMEVWDSYTKSQKRHFLYDHLNEIPFNLPKDFNKSKDYWSNEMLEQMADVDYNDLNESIRRSFDLHVSHGQYAKGGRLYTSYENPLEYLRSQTNDILSDLNYSTQKNGINYYVGYKGNKAIVVAFIEDMNNIMIDKEDAREMALTAKIRGVDSAELYTNYGIELHSKEKPKDIGFDKIYKVSVGTYAKGGSVEYVDLFEDYENIPDNVQAILDRHSEGFEDGDYKELEKAHKKLKAIGYTFEYGLDGEAYDLRKIGQKGKSEMEEYAKGGLVEQWLYFVVYPAMRGKERMTYRVFNEKEAAEKFAKKVNGEIAYQQLRQRSKSNKLIKGGDISCGCKH